MKKVLIAFGVLAAVVIIAVLMFASSATKTPETYTVGRQFIDHLAGSDYASAYALTATELQAENSQADLEAFVADRPELFTATTSIKFTQRGVDNDIRYAAGTLTSGDITVPLYMEFVDEGGVTKLIYFSFNEADIPEIGTESETDTQTEE